MALRNVERLEDLFRGIGMNIVTESQYLGGFVGFRAAKNSWMAEKVQGWSESVKTPIGVFCKHS